MSKRGRTSALVLGVGNILMKDEGLGVRVIEYLDNNYIFPPVVKLVDGGTMGLGLLALFKDPGVVIIIDALQGMEKGPVHIIKAENLPEDLPSRSSAHGIGVKELLAIADFEGYTPEVVLVGTVPEDISPGLELSPSIREKLPEIASTVVEELKKRGYGIKGRNNP